MDKIIFIAVFLLITVPAFSQEISLVRVVDGDTIVISESGKEQAVDIKGIDAPELEQGYGLEAKEALIQALKKKDHIYFQNKTKKRNGRTSGDVLAGRRNVSWGLIQNGFAWSENRSFNNSMLKLERKAKKGKVGLWAANSEPPWQWRKRNNINENESTYSVLSELKGGNYNSSNSVSSASSPIGMEIRRIKEKIDSLKKRCRSKDSFGYPGEDWCRRGPETFKARIKQLEEDPEYYFYKKGENSKNKKSHGAVVNPQTGKVIGVY